MVQAGYVPVTVLVVSDRPALCALCVHWNKLKSCPAIKQLGNGEGALGAIRVLPYQDVVLRILHHEVFEQEVEFMNCLFESYNILDHVYTS